MRNNKNNEFCYKTKKGERQEDEELSLNSPPFPFCVHFSPSVCVCVCVCVQSTELYEINRVYHRFSDNEVENVSYFVAFVLSSIRVPFQLNQKYHISALVP